MEDGLSLFDPLRMRNFYVRVIVDRKVIRYGKPSQTDIRSRLNCLWFHYHQINDTFVCPSTVFVTSNLDISSSSIHLQHIGLLDRCRKRYFLVLLNLNPGLSGYWKSHTCALLIRTIRSSKVSLVKQVRVGLLISILWKPNHLWTLPQTDLQLILLVFLAVGIFFCNWVHLLKNLGYAKWPTPVEEQLSTKWLLF